jgi:ankyrin repeat protein
VVFENVKKAIQQGKLRDIQELIEDYPEQLKRDEPSTLHIAIKDIRNTLLNMQNANDGNTYLHCSVIEEQLPILNYFVTLEDIKPNVLNKSSETPLMIATQKKYIEGVRSLLKIDSINPNLRNNDAKTPLVEAASNGSIEMCNLLLGHPKTKVYLRDKINKNALDYLFEKKLLDKLSDASIARVKSSSYPNFEPEKPESWIEAIDETPGRLIAVFQLPSSVADSIVSQSIFSDHDYEFLNREMCKIFTSSSSLQK